MQQVSARVVQNEQVMLDTFLLSLAVPPGLLANARPGQFVKVRCGSSADPLLRRPFSLHRFDPSSGRLDLLIRRVGAGTMLLKKLKEGSMVDLLGPLGQGFTVDQKTQHVLLLAGGIGIAPLVGLAEEALLKGQSVVLVAGAASSDHVFPSALVSREAEYRIMTEDGSVGQKGLATDELKDLLTWADQVFACGPWGMYEALNQVAFKLRYSRAKIQVSLEEMMACGVGACLGCVAFTKSGPQRVCKEGPVFGLREVL